jgi:hypothetical protein
VSAVVTQPLVAGRDVSLDGRDPNIPDFFGFLCFWPMAQLLRCTCAILIAAIGLVVGGSGVTLVGRSRVQAWREVSLSGVVEEIVRRILVGLLFLVVVCAVPSVATASTVTCPDTAVTTDNEYTLSADDIEAAIVDCEFGFGNINGNSNDDFLDNPPADQFGGGWDGCNLEFNEGDLCGIENWSWDPTSSTADFGQWSFDGDATLDYALGIKDGADPKWAVFLLADPDDDGFYEGLYQIIKKNKVQNDADPNGALSHWSIYSRELADTTTTDTTTDTTVAATTDTTVAATTDTTTVQGQVSEPTLLMLLGTGLVLAGRRLRPKAQ